MSSTARKPRKPSDALPSVSSGVDRLPGIGSKRADLLRGLGVEAVGDLLTYRPKRYIDRKSFTSIADLRPGEIQTFVGRVSAFEVKPTRGKRLCVARIEDASGRMRCVWFNQPYLKHVLSRGSSFVFSGAVRCDKEGPMMVHPEYEDASSDLLHTGRIVPVYRTRLGLSQRRLRVLVKASLDACGGSIVDAVPESLRRSLQLPGLRDAIGCLHFPSDLPQAEQARRRLAFDEMLLFQTLFALARKEKGRRKGRAGRTASTIARFTSPLPFEFTSGQSRALEDIIGDLESPYPMRRLLQGDVGCGKTVVAGLAVALACRGGGQAALLCPTEILAEQHLETFRKYLAPFGFSVELLTAGVAAEERLRVERCVETGRTSVVVGTHALLGGRVRFKDLRLAVVDEEQRFGVLQRTKLVQDAPGANLLVITATPIPRTLALTAYGDLDITLIGEMPPGRGKHSTRVVEPRAREGALAEIARKINAGLRGFYVCPALEEGSADLVDVATAREEIGRLLAPGRKTEILTGQTSREKRARILRDFLADKLGLVVATTVIEVGIDIPSATVLVVEQAERFGLSQLHQMRGRVARTDSESFSYLMVSGGASERARARLEVLESTFDGLEIAEQDLALRGPGDLVGTRQHGVPDLRFAVLPRDMDLMLRARDEAFGGVLQKEPSREWRAWIEAVKGPIDGRMSVI
jgi:ATP-dependent DNA helicase RecG